jgi:2-phosphoglycerate kinase
MNFKIYFTIKKIRTQFERTQETDIKVISTNDLNMTSQQVLSVYKGYECTGIDIK